MDYNYTTRTKHIMPKKNYFKSASGLDQVDNTSDVNKPLSIATQSALATKNDTLVSGNNIYTLNNMGNIY